MPARSWPLARGSSGVGNSSAGAHPRQRHDHRQVAGGVDHDDPPGRADARPEQRDQAAGDRRADDAPEVERRRVQTDGVGELVAPHHLVDERLPGGRVDRGADAEQEGDHVDVPDRHPTGDGQEPEQPGRDAHRCLRHGEDPTLGEAIGEHTGDGREQQDRQELQPGRDAERAGAAGERQHQPVLSDALHPRADVRHQRAGGEQPVVAVPQGGERRPHTSLNQGSIRLITTPPRDRGAERPAATAGGRSGRARRGVGRARDRGGDGLRRGPHGLGR